MAERSAAYQFQHLHQQQQQQARASDQSFWEQERRAIEAIPAELSAFKSAELPLARIKKIMKLDDDVKTMMIAAEAPLLFSKAAEIFIRELTYRAWTHTERARRRTLQRNDIALSVGDPDTDQFDFLIDIVPREAPQPPPQPPTVPPQEMVATNGSASSSVDNKSSSSSASSSASSAMALSAGVAAGGAAAAAQVQYVIQLPIGAGIGPNGGTFQPQSQPLQIFISNQEAVAATAAPGSGVAAFDVKPNLVASTVVKAPASDSTVAMATAVSSAATGATYKG